MHPADIHALLKKAGSSQIAVARELGVSHSAVFMVLRGTTKSARIAKRISEVTGSPIAALWPGKYARLEKLDAIARARTAIAKQLDIDRAAHAAKTTSKRKAA